LAEKVSDLGLDRLGQQSTRPIAQDFGELIVDVSWLNQLDDVIFGHGISLLRWRSGGVKHPHDMPPFRFPPSPTFSDSSPLNAGHDRAWAKAPLPPLLLLVLLLAADRLQPGGHGVEIEIVIRPPPRSRIPAPCAWSRRLQQGVTHLHRAWKSCRLCLPVQELFLCSQSGFREIGDSSAVGACARVLMATPTL